MSNTDPMKRMAHVRELFAAEQAKMPTVDHNGRPIDPPPAMPEPLAPEPTGLPAPNPALGSSASGTPDTKQLLADAQKAGDWKTVLSIIHSQMTQPQPPDAA